VVVYFSYRNNRQKALQRREEALRLAKKLLRKRGGSEDDEDFLEDVFRGNPKLDPGDMLMLRDKFKGILRPIIDARRDSGYGERLEALFFPPTKETRIASSQTSSGFGGGRKPMIEEQQINVGNQTQAGLLDLMDATVRPGVMLRLAFSGIDGGYSGLVMGHDMQGINVTLPANNDRLIASLNPGLDLEGTMESGSSLLAFTSKVIQAVAGSMPYCRISAWSAAWEVRKRDSLRLPISLEIDFQHISTGDSDSIRMASINNKIGSIRPGRLVDISLGGCCIETLSSSLFQTGDLMRFSHVLVEGSPPATLLGSVVKITPLDSDGRDSSRQRLHIQFLLIDDVSQRLLFRAVKQLQDMSERNEWLQAQQLMQKMRHNNIPILGSPAPALGVGTGRHAKAAPEERSASSVRSKPSTRRVRPATAAVKRLPAVPPNAKPPTSEFPFAGGGQSTTTRITPQPPKKTSTRKLPP
ncbi:MAG: PilZ domain-containing protein, partial [Planctomycetota bacterium]|nr:PilZ domain-containing protein [Planctomycetota bacterium]